jgi:hypothetical protein
MAVTLRDLRPALLVLTLCVAVGAANPLAQSEAPSVSNSMFTRQPVLNA